SSYQCASLTSHLRSQVGCLVAVEAAPIQELAFAQFESTCLDLSQTE
ncbi:hypothetical protein D046_5866B, partial [Vibrio parahaemolyticus V-223/04]